MISGYGKIRLWLHICRLQPLTFDPGLTVFFCKQALVGLSDNGQIKRPIRVRLLKNITIQVILSYCFLELTDNRASEKILDFNRIISGSVPRSAYKF